MSTQLANPTGTCGARVTIDEMDERVHCGTRYTLLRYETVAGSAGSCVLTLTTNTEKEIHITVAVETSGAGVWEMCEGMTVSGGTVLTALNNNRKSSNVCDCVIRANPTCGTAETVIGYHVIGSTTGGASKSGGSSSQRNEWILKQNTTYSLKFTADAPSTRVVQGIYFYEEAV